MLLYDYPCGFWELVGKVDEQANIVRLETETVD
jgi:hypothetical protein